MLLVKKSDTIIAGACHFDKVMRSQFKAMNESIPYGLNWEEGFINQFGDFLTRKEAMIIAQQAGQKINYKGCGNSFKTLYSEGLY